MHPDNRQQPARLNVRLDEKLRSRIEAAAQASRRSMNAEICHRIEHAFADTCWGSTSHFALNRALAGSALLAAINGQTPATRVEPPAGAVKPTLGPAQGLHHNGEPKSP